MSGSSLPEIALPKGGVMQGIGEKFSPDLHTGTGNFTVPIVLPLGCNGFPAQLNLVYSTDNGTGLFDLGWSLSIPGISCDATWCSCSGCGAFRWKMRTRVSDEGLRM